jgi:hypothetical protein
MPAIDQTLTFVGFAWLDEDGAINWAMREDLENVKPSDRPEGCTPVVIEITPTEEWALRTQKDYDFLGDISTKINQFSSDLEKLQHALKVGGKK